jgi:hypothetical protein
MSFVVISRLTGGAYLIPSLMRTVIALLSRDISGVPVARSGTGRSELSGVNEYSVRLTAYWTV